MPRQLHQAPATSEEMTPPAADSPQSGPILAVFSDRRSGPARRAEGFLAQVLQRRGNHGTFRVHHIDVSDRPEIAERFAVDTTPTLLVIQDKRVRARLAAPSGAREIEAGLKPWLK
jgi:thioredoxin-like negative regulator of GroEL